MNVRRGTGSLDEIRKLGMDPLEEWTCYTTSMSKLVCLRCQSQTGAAIRKGLRVYDREGFWRRPFNGILCGACLAQVRKLRSAENRWLLQRIAEQTNCPVVRSPAGR